MTEPNTPPELVLDDVVAVEADQLSEDQKTFLETNKADLTDEQAEKFSITREEEEEEPQTRAPATPPTKPKDDEEEDIDEEDQARISRIVDERLKQAGVGDTRDQLQVDSVIRDSPELSPYRARALKYMTVHPTLVAQDAMNIVTAKDQQKIGAQKEREAQEKAGSTRNSGGTVRSTGTTTGVDWSKASTEDINAKRDEIIRNSRE